MPPCRNETKSSRASPRAWGRRLLLLAAVVGLAVWWLQGSERPAMAHANLADARPAPNSVLETAPETVIAWFTEPIEAGLSEIRVLDSSGARVDLGDTTVDPNDPTAIFVGLEPLPNGTYTVAWRNVSTVDGHLVRGSFLFSVGEPLSAVSVEAPDQPLFQSPWEPVVRWAILIAALAVVGGLSFDLLVLRPALLDRRASPAVRRVGEAAASRGLRVVWLGLALLALASAAQLLLQAGSTFEKSWWGALGGPAWSIATETEWGRLWLWRVGLILASSAVLAAVYARFQRDSAGRAVHDAYPRLVRVLALAAAVGVLVTLSRTSHGAATAGIETAAVLSDLLHLSASAFWVGALFHLALGLPLLTRELPARERRAALSRMIPRFSAVAALSVGTVVVTGIFAAWAQVTAWAAFGTPYGAALIVKITLVAVLLALGAVNLVWVRPRLSRGDAAAVWLKRLVAVEAVLAVAVLAAVGVLTSLEPARQVASREGIGAPDSLEFRDVVEGAAILLTIAPGGVGPNEVVVSLEDRRGGPIVDATDVSVRLTYLEADLGEEAGSAVGAGDGTYRLSEVPMGIAGPWQAEVVVRRPDAFDARTAFRFETLAGGISGSSSLAPSPDTGRTLWAVELALIGLLFLAAGVPLGGLSTKTGAAVMGPGLAAFMAGAVLAAAQLVSDGGAPIRNPFPPDPSSLEIGKQVYELRCQSCHGPGGRGDGTVASRLRTPPADLVVHVPLHPDRDLFGFILDGIPGTDMVPLGDLLTDEQIWHVVNYVQTFQE